MRALHDKAVRSSKMQKASDCYQAPLHTHLPTRMQGLPRRNRASAMAGRPSQPVSLSPQCFFHHPANSGLLGFLGRG